MSILYLRKAREISSKFESRIIDKILRPFQHINGRKHVAHFLGNHFTDVHYYKATRLRETQQVTLYPSWVAKTFFLNQSKKTKCTNATQGNLYFGGLLIKAICIFKMDNLSRSGGIPHISRI